MAPPTRLSFTLRTETRKGPDQPVLRGCGWYLRDSAACSRRPAYIEPLWFHHPLMLLSVILPGLCVVEAFGIVAFKIFVPLFMGYFTPGIQA
jgi:hypothetical protein